VRGDGGCARTLVVCLLTPLRKKRRYRRNLGIMRAQPYTYGFGAACGRGGGCREMQLGNAKLGDKGDEGKEPSSLEPRVCVGAVVGVERCNLGMQNLATRVTKAKSRHRWSRVCGSGGGCREMQLGNTNLGGDGDEGKEPSSLEPRTWERWWVSRDATWDRKQILVTRVTKAKSHHRWGRACGSGGGCREMQLGNTNLGDKGDEGKEPSSLWMLNCRKTSCGRQTKCTEHVAVVGTASRRCGWN
jgi:hypothetical protein